MSVWKLSPNECRTLDLSNPDELLQYAKKLIGHSFREVLMLGISPDDSSMKDYGNVKFKGGMGTLIEERYFGYKANSDEHPDFPDAGVELKATCYDVNKDGELSAGERLSIGDARSAAPSGLGQTVGHAPNARHRSPSAAYLRL